MSEIKGTRRLLDLDIREVSLVDRAANLRQFLVIKRLEEETMKTFELDVAELTKSAGTEGEGAVFILKAMAEMDEAPKSDFTKLIEYIAKAEKAKPEEEEEMSKAVPADSIKSVVGWMKKMSKGPGAPTEAIAQVATFLGKVAGGTYPSQKKVDPDEMPPGEEEKKKAKELEDEKEAKKKAKDKELEDEKEAMRKALAEDNLDIRIGADGSVVVSGQTVSKAKKFTGPRTAQLKDTIISLMKLVAEVDEEATKEIQEAAKELPLGSNFASQVRPTGTASGESLKKSEVAEKLFNQLEDISKRLEKIETARPDTKVDGDGTAKPVQKGNDMWKGIV